jgi:hypothetical protein
VVALDPIYPSFFYQIFLLVSLTIVVTLYFGEYRNWSDCSLAPIQQFSAILWREQDNFQ